MLNLNRSHLTLFDESGSIYIVLQQKFIQIVHGSNFNPIYVCKFVLFFLLNTNLFIV